VGLFKHFYGRYAGSEGALKTEIVGVLMLEVPSPVGACHKMCERLRTALEAIGRRELYEGVIEEIRLFNKHFHVVPAMPEDGDPVKFYQAIINDPRGLPYGEGVAVKYKDTVNEWFKVKANDTLDVKVVRCIEGSG
jgi:ATP-dependent DNA ligase